MANQIELDSIESNYIALPHNNVSKPPDALYIVPSQTQIDDIVLKKDDLLIAGSSYNDNKFVTCSAIFSEETTYGTFQVPTDTITLLKPLSHHSVVMREHILKFLLQTNSTLAVSIAYKTDLLEGCGELSRGDTLSHFIARHASDMVFSHIFNKLHESFPFDLRNGENATILQVAVQDKNKATFDGILNLLKCETGDVRKSDFINNRLDNTDTVLHILACTYSPEFRIDLTGLMLAGAELEIESTLKRTCFHVAAEFNNSGFANAISEALTEAQGSDQARRILQKALEKKDTNDKVAALLAEEEETLKAILKLCNLEKPVFEDGRLIHYAAFTNNVMLCDCLVELGAVIDSFNNKSFTALKISSKKGHLDVTRSLLRAGANPNLVSKNPGFTALNNAAQFGHVECVRVLIEHGANLKSDDMATTPIHSAAYGGHVRVLDYFLKECNTDVNLLNTNGKVPLYQATIQGHTSCVQLLLRHGADVNHTLSDQGETLVHIAVKENRRQILRALLEHKAKPDEAMKNGKTPLMLAVEQDNVEFIPLIMSYGITLIKKDTNGNTVFHLLAKHGSIKSSKYLLRRVSLISGVTQEYQLYKNKNSNNKSPFDIALENRQDKVLEQFIRYMPEQKKKKDHKMFHQLYDKGLYHIIKLIIRELPSQKSGQYHKVNSRFVDSNSDGHIPEDANFSPSKSSFLHKLASCPDFSLILHPLIDSIINAKYQIYRWWVPISVTMRYQVIQHQKITFWHSLYQDSKQNLCPDNLMDVEFLNPKTNIEKFPLRAPRVIQVGILKFKDLLYKLDSKLHLIFSAAMRYFFRTNTLLGIIGFCSLLILISLRILNSRYQWLMAAFVFMSYSLSLFRYAKINPTLGLYMSVLLRLLYTEVPKFICAFILLSLTCSGALHLIVRFEISPIPSSSSCNQTLNFSWFGEYYHPVYSLLAPIFFLVNPGIGEGVFSLYQAQSITFVLFYLIFTFIISIFMISLFIAQITKSYRTIGNFEILQFKLDTIIEIERNSIVSLVFGKWLRKSSSVMKVLIPKQKWEEEVLKDENNIPLYNSNVVTQETNRQVLSSKELVEKKMEELNRTTDGLSNNIESMQDTLTHVEQFQTDIQVQLDSIRVALQHLQQCLVK
ncbi:WD40 repeat-containing protein [Oopsacas minuta]|uniref:WD40 repeat-containing protein n=1 Tax=Oopsacas minuta TaxID=111878 RepID=A0AAV7K2G4_9METZ|nr:WD40 repeat-containing protein [Oopsacas minuta]